MKKIIAIICLIVTTMLVGCGKYEPTLSKTGVQYVSKTNKMQDGQYASIIVKSVEKDGDSIVIKTESPIEQMLYAYNNFISFTVINEKGEESDKNEFKIKEVKEQGEFIVTPKSMSINEIKYIQIDPYKDGDNALEFEVK